MLNRRGFLGSVIGVTLGSQFLARRVCEPQQMESPTYRYRTGLILPSGDIIQGTVLAEAIFIGSGWHVVFAPLQTLTSISFIGAVLLNKHGKVEHEGKFNYGQVRLSSGDTFNVDFSITNDPRYEWRGR